VPAAAVIPAPIVYIKFVVVEKLVVELQNRLNLKKTEFWSACEKKS